MGVVIFLVLLSIFIGLFFFAVAYHYKKVGPHEVLIITGGRGRVIKLPDGKEKKVGYRIRIGGGTFVVPLLESFHILPLQIIPMDFEIPDVIAQNGVKGAITGTAQVKINGSEPAVHLAAEQFLGRSITDIQDIAIKTIEGHARAIIGTKNLEVLNKERRVFNQLMMDGIQPDFSRMGLLLISINLKDIKDSTGYLEALGRPVIAQAKRNAEVAQAEAARDAIIKSAEAQKEGDVAKLRAETEVAEATRDFELRRSEFQAMINEKKAISDYTYDLERQRMNQLVKEEEHKVLLKEKEHAIVMSQKDIERANHDLEAKVKGPASAEKFRIIQESEAMAEAKRIQGEVEADLIRKQGNAEAESLRLRAEAMKSYSTATLVSQLIEVLPRLAREIAEPLSKIEKIVIVNSGSSNSAVSRVTGDIAEALAQIPTVFESVAGVNLKKLLSNLPGGSDQPDIESESHAEQKE